MNKVAMSLPITNKIGRPRAMDEEAREIQKHLRNKKNCEECSASLRGAGVTERHMRLGKRGAVAVSTFPSQLRRGCLEN